MKKVLLAVVGTCVADVCLAADVAFTGTGRYLDPTAWAAGALPEAGDTVNVEAGAELTFDGAADLEQVVGRFNLGSTENGAASPATFFMQSGNFKPARFYVASPKSNAAGGVVQTGGILSVTQAADPNFAVGGEASTGDSTYSLEAGELRVTGTGHVGGKGRGVFNQVGGEMSVSMWFVIGRYEGAVGVYNLTGGRFLSGTGTTYGTIVGEAGRGTLNVSGGGTLETQNRLGVNGCSQVNLGTGGTIKVSFIEKQPQYNGTAGEFNFDGGTLVYNGVPAVQGEFIKTTLDHVYVKDGGGTINVPAGKSATILKPIEAHPDATGGDLVKTGGGTLVLAAANTFKGKMRVLEGTLVLKAENALPSLGADKLEIAPGAAVAVGATFPQDMVSALAARIAAVQDAGFGIDTSEGDVTWDADITLGANATFTKTGPNTLTLTGSNTWGGETRIEGGTLAAKRGQGLPAASPLKILSGTWAPLEESAVLPIGTGAGEFSVAEGANEYGFAALEGATAITLGSADTTIVPGMTENLTSSRIILDARGAESSIALANPITMSNGDVTLDAPGEGKVSVDGPISATDGTRWLNKTGSGDVSFTGGFTVTGDQRAPYLCVKGGDVEFGSGTSSTFFDLVAETGGIINLTNGANVVGTGGWFYAGRSGSGSAINMSNGALSVGTTGERRLNIGYNVGSEGTFNFSGGEINNARLCVGGTKGRGTFVQTGGSLTSIAESYVGQFNAPGNGEAKSAESLYTISGGTAQINGNFQVGKYSDGRVEQSGGAVTVTGWLCVGRNGGSAGTYNMTAGTVDCSAYGFIVGEDGTGRVRLSGDAVVNTHGMGTGWAAGGWGEVSVEAGARLNTTFISQPYGRGSFYFNDATLGALGENQTLLEFFRNVKSLEVGSSGLTFDTGNNNVYSGEIPVSPYSEGVVTKTGSGVLGLARLPSSGELRVAEGTLALTGGKVDASRDLVHRWSFNGSMADSVSGMYAELYKGAGAMVNGSEAPPVATGNVPVYTEDGKAVLLAGGADADMVGLGADILPASGSVTIEIWSTLVKHTTWEKMLAIGSSQQNGILFTFSKGSDGNKTATNLLGGGGTGGDMSGTGYFNDGVPYYTALVFQTAPDGSTLLNVYTRNAATGERLGSYAFKGTWKLENLVQNGAWLGWGWWNDKVSNASFDEVRVWKTALSETDADRHVALGPDALPAGEPEVADGNVYPAEVSGTDYLTHRWSFNGTLFDQVTGRTAQLVGDGSKFVSANNAVDCAAGGNNKNYINLGTEVLPRTGPVTIEMWCTLLEPKNWCKALVIGNNGEDSIVFTFNKSSATGPTAFRIANDGQGNDNREGTGMCPVGEECYITITMTPSASGTDVAARLWNAASRALIGTMAYTTSWTPARLGQNYARLNSATFWGDPDPHAVYNEFRVWNVSLSEEQQRVNVSLGPDIVPDISSASPSMLDVADGAVVDLVGDTVEQYGVKGAGKVQNGTLVVTGVLSPGGDGVVGTLKLDAGVKVKGTILLDVGDLIECAGEADLTEATVMVADTQNLRSSYTFLTSADGGVKGPVKEELVGKGRMVGVTPTRATIRAENITIFVR